MTVEQQPNGASTDEDIIDTAIGLTGIGKFTIKMVVINSLILLNAGFTTNGISLIFPASACDFNLTTMDQGLMTATPFSGMIVGSYFWGCLADLHGRKYALVIALFSQGLFEMSSSLISNFWGYIFFKFLSGFSLIAQNAIVYPYVGEFQPPILRKKVLCTLELAWVVGTIALPVLGYLIIPLDVSYTTDYFFFHSWNLFVFLYSLLAPALGIWLLTFPESPKYLAAQGEDADLAKALDVMHSQNTGESFDIFLQKLTDNGLDDLRRRLELKENQSASEKSSKCEKAEKILRDIMRNTGKLFRPPFLTQTLLICILWYCVASTFFSFTMWFPELVRRLAAFEEMFPNESAWICSAIPAENSTITANVSKCLPNIPTEVFHHTLILGAACLPTNLLVPLFVNKLGFKFFLVSSSTVAMAVTVGLFFVRSSTQNLILSSIYEGFLSISSALVLVVITELYPTQIRATASSLGVLLGRIGSVIGNLLMGHLIDNHCVIFISSTIVQLIVCLIVSLILPIKRRDEKSVSSSVVTLVNQ
ncbi:synaptic vesicle glycoprotein 2C [Fopius arisanus]|uniref:Sv2b_0 protein n=1 Tax=Fopius arisanus TaxID=64838 RepID=A0A0C9PTN9_9HYME|nr:PREDICTED: synaptic vesicle glycoprotein 2C-like [Fopius arisanus]